MKKSFSIVMVIVILLAGLQALVSVHYCGGSIADSRVSLAGAIATCGMEDTEDTCPAPGGNLDRHCCEDQINVSGIINQYTAPSPEPDSRLNNNPNISFIEIYGFHSITVSSTTASTNLYPPGYCLANTVCLENICVFRI